MRELLTRRRLPGSSSFVVFYKGVALFGHINDLSVTSEKPARDGRTETALVEKQGFFERDRVIQSPLMKVFQQSILHVADDQMVVFLGYVLFQFILLKVLGVTVVADS